MTQTEMQGLINVINKWRNNKKGGLQSYKKKTKSKSGNPRRVTRKKKPRVRLNQEPSRGITMKIEKYRAGR